MKNILVKLFCIFAFILCFAVNVFAAGNLNISSVVYDNSSALLTVNSLDNEEFSFTTEPKIHIVEDENKAYFDIEASILRCPAQDLIITSSDIKEIMVKQFSADPNIVRVVIYYKDNFNPKNIQLKKLNNSLFVTFKPIQIQNFYFQHMYSDEVSNIDQFYEHTSIQTPVQVAQNNLLSQIDSAFNLGSTTEDKNYILSKKSLILPTKYYVDNVNIKNSAINISGIGSLTLSSPMYLSNPTRVAYDIANAMVNPTIRNKTIYISQNATIKIGQFDKATARIVITSPNADKYIPVIYGDSQRLVFIDSSVNSQSLFSSNVTLNSVIKEPDASQYHSVKLIFSKPVIYGIERTSSTFDLLLYNVNKHEDDLNISSILEGAKFSNIAGGGIKLSIPANKANLIDIHVGSDGKTLRIKEKYDQIVKKPEPAVVVELVVPVHKSSKKLVVIDPGHGGSDVGCTRNGLYEKNITLDVSKRTEELLKKMGYDVVMTRDNDKTVSLQERVEISENVSPVIFVSIHVNSSNIESPNGIETHYYKDNSLQLAKTVHASMLNNINANNRGLFKSKFYVINHTTAPAILVEIGFISNSAERAQLVSDSRKQATAKAIAEGIDDYLK